MNTALRPLNSRSAARVADYVLGRDPRAVLLPSTYEIPFGSDGSQPSERDHPLARAIRMSPEFTGYRPVLGVRIHEAKYFYLFLRHGTNLRGRPGVRHPHECLEVWNIETN